jgi:hypothetical protein
MLADLAQVDGARSDRDVALDQLNQGRKILGEVRERIRYAAELLRDEDGAEELLAKVAAIKEMETELLVLLHQIAMPGVAVIAQRG